MSAVVAIVVARKYQEKHGGSYKKKNSMAERQMLIERAQSYHKFHEKQKAAKPVDRTKEGEISEYIKNLVDNGQSKDNVRQDGTPKKRWSMFSWCKSKTQSPSPSPRAPQTDRLDVGSLRNLSGVLRASS
mmetsp:Transcript_132315/g.197144  ORF Transcript_132315/g.197144 Transcript_132315/m.197144 type:complete len:130 (-) Transcript_132315:72-461(-)